MNKIKLYFLYSAYCIITFVLLIMFIPMYPLLMLADAIQQTISNIENSNPFGFKEDDYGD